MTLKGTLIIIAELILVIFALGTGFEKLLIVAACLGGVIIYSLVSLLLAILTIKVRSSIDKKSAQRGEIAKYTLSVYGAALLPVSAYFIMNSVDSKPLKKEKSSRHSFMLLPTFSVKRDFTFELLCAHIGQWQMGVKKIRAEDLFGLFAFPLVRSRKSDFSIPVSIMPNFHDLSENEQRISSGGFGDSNRLDSEDGETLGDSRSYRMGDSLKRINWKQSARTKKLHSRMFEMTQGPIAVIVVDASVRDRTNDNIVDIICETAVSLSQYFVEQGDIVSVVTVRGEAGSGRSVFEIQGMADVLKLRDNFVVLPFGKAKAELTISEFDGMQVLNADRVYFITENPSDELISTAQDINKIGRVACCIVPTVEEIETESSSKFGMPDISRVDIASAEQIKEKVGAAL